MALDRSEFKVTVLPDDPKLSPGRTRRRALTQRNGNTYSKSHTARSATKPHQHHLLTATRCTEKEV